MIAGLFLGYLSLNQPWSPFSGWKPSLEWNVSYQSPFLENAQNFDFCSSCSSWLSKEQLSFATISCRLANILRAKALLCFGPTSLDSPLLLGFGLVILCYFSSFFNAFKTFEKTTIAVSGKVDPNCLACHYKNGDPRTPILFTLPFLIVPRWLPQCHVSHGEVTTEKA